MVVPSDGHVITYGIPQGSLIIPICYPKYLCPLANIAKKHDVKLHQYMMTLNYMWCVIWIMLMVVQISWRSV